MSWRPLPLIRADSAEHRRDAHPALRLYPPRPDDTAQAPALHYCSSAPLPASPVRPSAPAALPVALVDYHPRCLLRHPWHMRDRFPAPHPYPRKAWACCCRLKEIKEEKLKGSISEYMSYPQFQPLGPSGSSAALYISTETKKYGKAEAFPYKRKEGGRSLPLVMHSFESRYYSSASMSSRVVLTVTSVGTPTVLTLVLLYTSATTKFW